MQAEAETLAHLSGTLLSEQDPIPALMGGLRTAFGCASVSVHPPRRRRLGHREQRRRTRADRAPTTPRSASPSTPTPGSRSAVPGSTRKTSTCSARSPGQLALAVERRRLRAEAAAAEGLAEANELRTALLVAVSHDLRTPLSSIKASVTSLRQRDVALTAGDRGELLETIDGEADRLNNLVGNLLDMSRLQTGAVELVWRDVGLEEVVPAALHSLGATATTGTLLVDVAEALPRVRADVALLERAIANIVANALHASPPDRRVRIFAGATPGQVELSIADKGPGIPRDKREAVFRPFQRLGDSPQGSGVGLGLAVARGFVEAMDGTLTIDDTPGGGTTVTISLPAAAEPGHYSPALAPAGAPSSVSASATMSDSAPNPPPMRFE